MVYIMIQSHYVINSVLMIEILKLKFAQQYNNLQLLVQRYFFNDEEIEASNTRNKWDNRCPTSTLEPISIIFL